MKTSVFLAVLSAFSLQAAAHQHASLPHPSDPARSPIAGYESAFRGYVASQEQRLAAWKALNDEVHRIGGHAGIFRGDSARDAKDNPAATSAPASIPAAEHSQRVSPRPAQNKTTKPGHSYGGHK